VGDRGQSIETERRGNIIDRVRLLFDAIEYGEGEIDWSAVARVGAQPGL
jgi:hypothetical protein